MSNRLDISVVISTYNRCDQLSDAIRCLLNQEARGASYEIIVVDNNSTDDTRQVVESFIHQGCEQLRYVFEGKQGASNGRNAGIRNARGSILAFTDDDVRVPSNWVAAIKRSFDEYPEVCFVGGKVLPVWPDKPPYWLTREHWMPLAILDYGDSEISLIPEKTRGLVAANLAVRRETFEDVGMFSQIYQLTGSTIGAVEDHELIARIWRAGGEGKYLPNLVVTTNIPLERLTKQYHRRWHAGHGRFYALLREPEMERAAAHLFAVPSHLYKQCMIDIVQVLRHLLAFTPSTGFLHQVRLWFFIGYFCQRVRDFKATNQHGLWRDFFAFTLKIVNKVHRTPSKLF